jgi:hypothetical protein
MTDYVWVAGEWRRVPAERHSFWRRFFCALAHSAVAREYGGGAYSVCTQCGTRHL